jgi:ATP-dependent Lon protease
VGEITLRGEILPIGGLKEKLLAALRGGVRIVLIPEENRRDLQEIPENIKDNLEIRPVRWMDEVLSVALLQKPTPIVDDSVIVSSVPTVETIVVEPLQQSIQTH